MAESMQHRLDRVRKPRVQITYDVEIGGAIQMKELPFVVGVLSDLTGNPEGEVPKMKDRKFVDVNRDNFNQVLQKMKPRVAFKAPNRLTDDPDSQLAVDITFESMKDFEPEQVVKKVKPLRELLEIRQDLKEMLNKATTIDEVGDFLKKVMQSEESAKKLAGDVGAEAPAGGDGGPAKS